MSNKAVKAGILKIQGVCMHLDSEFISEVPFGPHVVVAKVPVHIQSAIDQFRDATQEAHASLWDHMAPFEPEIKEVADQVKTITFPADLFNPFEEYAFPVPRCFSIGSTQVEVGSEMKGQGKGFRAVFPVPSRVGCP